MKWYQRAIAFAGLNSLLPSILKPIDFDESARVLNRVYKDEKFTPGETYVLSNAIAIDALERKYGVDIPEDLEKQHGELSRKIGALIDANAVTA